MRPIVILLGGLAAVLTVQSQAQSQEWSQWRGPSRDGVVRSFTPPAAWPERATPLWKVDAGIGHSSPVVAGGRVLLFSRVGEQEAMTAWDLATGRQAWRQAYDAPYRMNPAATGHGKGPKSTPVVQGGRVFALGIGGILSAFDAASGKVLWRHDFSTEPGSPEGLRYPGGASPDFGASMSPIVDGDRVIAHVGGAAGGAIVAFDVATGARRWSWAGDGPAYASPVIATAGGTRHLITQTQSHVVSLSPADGRELWRQPFTTDYDQNIVTPLVIGDLLISGGLQKPTVAARITKAGASWTVAEVWRNPDVPMYMSSPVAADGVIYGFTHRNRGQFFAVDAASGRTLWTSPPRQGENAALAIAGDVVVSTTAEGTVTVLQRGRTAYRAVRTYTVAESPVWAHPAFAAGTLLVKDADTLSAWRF